MVTIQSLGLHKPSALTYLITESILPPDPPVSSYRWCTYRSMGDDKISYVEEEVLIAKSCVVWSRNGTIQRVLNLTIEQEPILHAFPTWLRPSRADISTDRKDTDPILSYNFVSRGLVVILKSQAHIFLLSGENYVLPLSFEVGAAFPNPYGFLLQRKVGSNEIRAEYSSPAQDLSTINESQGILSVENHGLSFSLLDKLKTSQPSSSPAAKGMPRTFSFTEPLSDLGLVVASPSRKPQDISECKILSENETLLYVSTGDELKNNLSGREPLCIALTVNHATSTFTIWHCVMDGLYGFGPQTQEPLKQRKSGISRRKSSNVYGRPTGSATPRPTAQNTFRESFGGPTQPHTENLLFSSTSEQKSFPLEDLASQLGPEFGDVGVQTRSARRVSSMLVRTDLGSANDRTTFNDFALGQRARKSLNRGTRRGESIGSFGDRQSFGPRRRSSFPTNFSILSKDTSLFNTSTIGYLDDGEHAPLPDPYSNEWFDEDESDLTREIGFWKVKSFEIPEWNLTPETSSELQIMTLLSPTCVFVDGMAQMDLSLCLMNKTVQEISIVNLLVKDYHSKLRSYGRLSSWELKANSMRRGSAIADACQVVDNGIERLLILSETRHGRSSLHLEAPWSAPFNLDPPTSYLMFDPFQMLPSNIFRTNHDVGTGRVIPSTDVAIAGVKNFGTQGKVLLNDQRHGNHALNLQLAPRDVLVRSILSMCDLVLFPCQAESLLVAFWEVSNWIKAATPTEPSDWTIITVVLFSLAVPFISDSKTKSSAVQRRKRGLLRSSSGTMVDLSDWDGIRNANENASTMKHLLDPAWNWLQNATTKAVTPSKKTKHIRTPSLSQNSDTNSEKNLEVERCISWARDFMQTPTGEAAMGPEGYMPTSTGKDREQRRTALAKILLGMHVMYEEQKLHTLSAAHCQSLATQMVPVMIQIGTWLGWEDWTRDHHKYYATELPDHTNWFFDESTIDELDIPPQPLSPPSIFQYIGDCISGLQDVTFLLLPDIAGITHEIDKSHPQWNEARRLTPYIHILTTMLSQRPNVPGPSNMLDDICTHGINRAMLESLPEGIAAAFNQAISAKNRNSFAALSTSTRNKLEERNLINSTNSVQQRHKSGKPYTHTAHEAIRDSHSIGSAVLEAESLQRWDASSEVDRHNISRLIFDEDRRFQEASKLVNQTRPPLVECTPEPDWSEADLLEAQKELVQFVTRRTLSVAAGRGMMHFHARMPLLTERVPIPAFSLQCFMKPRNASETTQAMTLSADKTAFTEDKVCWAFFHNGASAGLMISRDAKCIDTSWILYNKPPELTNRHAGFLLALGLSGHLKSLAKWVAFKYLTPKHTMTSIGLLLGLSASYLGTMDTLITRLLSVHVTRLLPLGAAELNLSPLTQTTGIMGIGLLYCNSQHRRMSEVMISEMENKDLEERGADEIVLRDEGYRLAAGFALGLINLGQGNSLHSLHDMNVLERLLSVAIGTKNVNLVHVLDRTTAGAVMATAFIFMKTNDEAVARKIDIPDTLHQFDYVRPDIFLLRTLARHLVMWDSIRPTPEFVKDSLPRAYGSRASLKSTKYLSTEDMPFFNIVAGICFAIGLRFAGSQRQDVRDLLIEYLDQFLRLSKLSAANYDARVTLNSVRNCLDVIALASASVVAGSGDLVVMRRLRALHGRTDKDTPFGSHLAAHMALGALFLGGGTCTFGTSNLAVASLCIAFYPLFPNDVLDNQGHLQALRHLWVLAVEHRCLIVRSSENGTIITGIDGEVQLKNGDLRKIRTPGLLPAIDTIQRIKIAGSGYWDVTIDFNDPNLRNKVESEQGINVYVQRRSAYDEDESEVLFAELQALQEASGIPSINPNTASNLAWSSTSGPGKNPFDWVFDLNNLSDLDHAERGLILGVTAIDGQSILRGTVVDTRLEFEKGTLIEEGLTKNPAARSMNKDQLWQLRLLFEWTDRWDREDEEMEKRLAQHSNNLNLEVSFWHSGNWLRREVIHRLKWMVWKLADDLGELETEAE